MRQEGLPLRRRKEGLRMSGQVRYYHRSLAVFADVDVRGKQKLESELGQAGAGRVQPPQPFLFFTTATRGG